MVDISSKSIPITYKEQKEKNVSWIIFSLVENVIDSHVYLDHYC